MYPANYFGLFPAFPRDEVGFVAMSFDPRCDARWKNVIAPSIAAVGIGDVRLKPHRVDLGTAGDSILTEILDSIARCRVFIGDITALDELNGKPIRNANVFYEVGIAHSVRLPEEVILVRSDNLRLDFDIANVRVYNYNPDHDPESAKKFLAEKVFEAVKSVDQKKNLAVRRAVSTLDFKSWWTLTEANLRGPIHHPSTRTMGEALGAVSRANAIQKLLEMGALKAEFIRPTEDLLKSDTAKMEELILYRVTSFGKAVLEQTAVEQGMFDPEMQKLITKYGGPLTVDDAKVFGSGG